MSKTDKLLIQVAERYMFHANLQSENQIAQEMANIMREIEIDEMWMLTQN